MAGEPDACCAGCYDLGHVRAAVACPGACSRQPAKASEKGGSPKVVSEPESVSRLPASRIHCIARHRASNGGPVLRVDRPDQFDPLLAGDGVPVTAGSRRKEVIAMTDTSGTLIGRTSFVARYTLFLSGDTVTVLDDEGVVTRRTVAGLGAFVTKAKTLRTGWGQFPDGMEVIYVYDRDDDNFGYALNLDAPECSEWGYAPLAPGHTSVA
jgi:hypothetical protein